MDIFKDRLKTLMKSRSLKQADLATQLPSTTATVSRWLSGKQTPKGKAAHDLARFFGVEKAWLVDGSDAGELAAEGYLQEDSPPMVRVERHPPNAHLWDQEREAIEKEFMSSIHACITNVAMLEPKGMKHMQREAQLCLNDYFQSATRLQASRPVPKVTHRVKI